MLGPVLETGQFGDVAVATGTHAFIVIVELKRVEFVELVQLNHPRIDKTVDGGMIELGLRVEPNHGILNARPADKKVPRREPDVALPNHLHREDVPEDVVERGLAHSCLLLAIRHLRHLDLPQVRHLLNLDDEVPRNHLVRLVGLDDIGVLNDAEVGAVDGLRTGYPGVDHHVAWQMIPLVELLA